MGYVLLFLKKTYPHRNKQRKFSIISIRDVPSASNNVSTATDYNYKATELNEQGKRFLWLYLLNFISVLLDF